MGFDKNGLSEQLEYATKHSGAFGGAVMFYDSENNVLRCAASVNIPKDWENIVNSMDAGLNAAAVTSRSPVLKNGLNIDSFPGTVGKHLITSVLIVPIVRMNAILGTIELLSDSTENEFSVNDVIAIEERMTDFADCFDSNFKGYLRA